MFLRARENFRVWRLRSQQDRWVAKGTALYRKAVKEKKSGDEIDEVKRKWDFDIEDNAEMIDEILSQQCFRDAKKIRRSVAATRSGFSLLERGAHILPLVAYPPRPSHGQVRRSPSPKGTPGRLDLVGASCVWPDRFPDRISLGFAEKVKLCVDNSNCVSTFHKPL